MCARLEALPQAGHALFEETVTPFADDQQTHHPLPLAGRGGGLAYVDLASLLIDFPCGGERT
jgi:hypothetical protein